MPSLVYTDLTRSIFKQYLKFVGTHKRVYTKHTGIM